MITARKDSAVHVSLSSYLIVKQQSLVKQNSLINQNGLINPATRLRPAPKRPLPGFLTGWFLGPRNSREAIRAGRPRQRWRRCPAYRSRPLPLSTRVFKKTSKQAPPRLTSCGEFTYFSSYLLQLFNFLLNHLARRTFGLLAKPAQGKSVTMGVRYHRKFGKGKGARQKQQK
ncbi:MAG: hypothetical protein WBE80_02880 [Methylocella sp.]